MCSSIRILLAAIVLHLFCVNAGSPLPQPWTHGWDTALEAQFIDTGYSRLTEEQANWTAHHYAIYSVEKCTGYNARRGTFTEAATYDTALQLKRYAPNMRVLFYLHTEVISLNCYSAFSIYLQHPEWWLYDDAGVLMNNTGQSANIPLLDFTVPAARAFWVGIPLNGTGSPAAGIIDGLLADGAGTQTNFCGGARISASRCATLVAAKQEMIREAQALFNATNGGSVLQNALDSDPTLVTLPSASGIMAEHFAAFEYITRNAYGPGTWAYNAGAIAAYMNRIATAVAAGKTVVVACWVGPASVPFTSLGFPSWPLRDEPTSLPGWRDALVAWHPFALAGFLTVAETSVWMQYQGWYTQFQGAIGCNGDSTCVAPEPWYADLYRPLGRPLGPAVRMNNTWTRRFERAVSYWDLDRPNASGVTWLSESATGSGTPSGTASPSATGTATGTSTGSGSSSWTQAATESETSTPSMTESASSSVTASQSYYTQTGSAASTRASSPGSQSPTSTSSTSASPSTLAAALASTGAIQTNLRVGIVVGSCLAAVIVAVALVAILYCWHIHRVRPLQVRKPQPAASSDPSHGMRAVGAPPEGAHTRQQDAIELVQSPIPRATAQSARAASGSYRHLRFDAEQARKQATESVNPVAKLSSGSGAMQATRES
jgi:hypothetical protein